MATRSPIDRLALLRRLVLVLVVVGVPVVFVKDLFMDAFNVPKFALLSAGVGVALALKLYGVVARREHFVTHGAWVPVGAIVVPLFASWVASPYREWALFGQFPRFQGLIPYVVFGVLGLLLVDAFDPRPRALAFALAIAGAIAGAYVVIQSLGLDPLTWIVDGAPFPVTASTGGHPNYTGGFLAITLPIAVYLWSGTGPLRFFGAFATVCIVGGLIMSLSQGPWAAAVGGLTILVGGMARARSERAHRVALIAAMLVGVAMIAPVVASLTLPTDDADRFGATSRTRGLFWAASFDMAAEHPIFGGGPNAFAIESVRYRPLEEALRVPFEFTDDPHSLPFSFLANAGILGLVGFGLFGAWIVARTLRLPRDDLLGYAFAGAAIAYILQGLVGVDEPIQRVGAWTAVAGLAIRSSATDPRRALDIRPRTASARRAIAVLVALGVASVSVVWSIGFVRADRSMLESLLAFDRDDVAEARDRFKRAIAFRDEYLYRHFYGSNLGFEALDRGPSGQPLMDEMVRVTHHLEHFPEQTALYRRSEALHHWGHFEPAADEAALEGYTRLLAIDPQNPLVETEMSEVLLDLGREREALALLERLQTVLRGRAPDYWAILAITHWRIGDEAAAQDTLELARSAGIGSRCRTEIASLLIRGARPARERSLFFMCPEGLIHWYQDQRGARA